MFLYATDGVTKPVEVNSINDIKEKTGLSESLIKRMIKNKLEVICDYFISNSSKRKLVDTRKVTEDSSLKWLRG